MSMISTRTVERHGEKMAGRHCCSHGSESFRTHTESLGERQQLASTKDERKQLEHALAEVERLIAKQASTKDDMKQLEHALSEVERLIAKQDAESRRRKARRNSGVAVNIAVIGRTGVGKSSFINAIRGLSADDEGAAAVGVIETTTQITSYTHPDHPDVTFWDLPGVGTDQFPQAEYLRLINVGRYDFFVIISATRFYETDTWLVNEISRRGKGFAFVRTKVDVEVRSNRKAHPRSHSSEAVVAEILASTIEHLNHTRQTSADVFLIDSYATHKYDFERLAGRLLDVLPESKNSVTTNRQCILS